MSSKKEELEEQDFYLYDEYDAHSCSAFANEYGVCQFCGAVVPGTMAYSDIYGGE